MFNDDGISADNLFAVMLALNVLEGADHDCEVQCNKKLQDGRSLTGHYLEKIGILTPLRSRWDKDGTWNWNPLIFPHYTPSPDYCKKNVQLIKYYLDSILHL